jgi:sterol desaturase/sphingolipid hydroxylase (fatty acid hydroxylase superfamily)
MTEHKPVEDIIHDTTPIRLFQSNFLEFFTHIHPVTIFVIYVPVVAYFLWQAAAQHVSIGAIIPAFLAGLLIWTLSEYMLHRFVFHFHSNNPTMQRITFLFHGIHHKQPQEPSRLVMPPVVSLPLAALFFGLFRLVIGYFLSIPQVVGTVFAGFIVGYLTYDLTHYATHHFAMRSGVFKYLKRYHMQHHYKTPNMRFGVSSPLWDIIFGTKTE